MTEWTLNEFDNWIQQGSDINLAINVTTLNLNDNQLTTLPDSIGNLTNLEKLILDNNQLTTLPNSIGNLTNLETLFLDNNQLTTTLPDSIENLTNLEDLYLDNNQLTILPDSIGNLTNLETLDLKHNQLTILPDSIGNLTNLEFLYLNHNQLTILPDSIGNLTNLKFLYLDNNQLTTLPNSIGNLTNLEELYLDNNQLTILPDSIRNLTNLQILELDGNRFDEDEDEVSTIYDNDDDDEDDEVEVEAQPQGIAYEIHNAFETINIDDIDDFFDEKVSIEIKTIIKNEVKKIREKNIGKNLSKTILYQEIIREIKKSSKEYIIDSTGNIPNFQNMNNFEFHNFIESRIDEFLINLSDEPIPTKSVNYYPENIKTWKDIWNVLYNERIQHLNFYEYKKTIGLALLYTSLQSKIFIENYVKAYLNDVAFAYDSGTTFTSNFSCGKGMIERFITSLTPAIDAMETLPIIEEETKEETKSNESKSEELTNEKLEEYKILKGKLKGGFDEDVAKKLIMDWQEETNNKNIISNEDGSFKEGKEQIITNQKKKLIEYLCCELTITEEMLLGNNNIKNILDYMFSEDNILDYNLGGKKTRKNKRIKKIKKKTKKSNKSKNKTKKSKKGKKSKKSKKK
jgi:Leucine-rich repeat (LRR) protein